MKEFKYTITDPEGIHARPAGQFVKACASYPCNITVEKDGKAVNAKGILGIMSLGVKQGQEITVKVDGEKEDEAATELEAFLKANL